MIPKRNLARERAYREAAAPAQYRPFTRLDLKSAPTNRDFDDEYMGIAPKE